MNEPVWPEMKNEYNEEADWWQGSVDMKSRLLKELCMWVKETCTQCIHIFIASADGRDMSTIFCGPWIFMLRHRILCFAAEFCGAAEMTIGYRMPQK